MRSVDLKVLKDELGEYIRLAAAGETVLIVDRDDVVAQITAPDATTRDSSPVDDVRADAVRSVWLTPPAITARGMPAATRPAAPLADLLAELEADRRAR